MKIPYLLLLAPALAAPRLLPQDLLHFKFDDRAATAINYAAGSPAPAEGAIVTNLAAGPKGVWKQGVWGGALAGGDQTQAPQAYSYIDTGWNHGTITGSLSYAFWLRMSPQAPTPSLSYLFGNGTNFRIFTGGGGFFLTSGWGGSNVNTVANIQTLAKQKWIHLALVIDAAALRATYYIDGVPESPLTITGGANFAGTAFYVGKYSGLTNASIFDMDEFILANRAFSPAEIAVLSRSPKAADGRYGSGGCGGLLLSSSGGAPAPGNSQYTLELNSPGTVLYSLGFGASRSALGALPLPFHLGLIFPQSAGCHLECDPTLFSVSGAKPAGLWKIPFPIPPLPAIAGLTLFAQAPSIDAGSGNLIISSAFSIGIGL